MTVPQPVHKVAFLGLPYDASSSFLRGPALAPVEVAKELRSDATNPYSENGLHIDLDSTLEDRANLALPTDPETARDAIDRQVADILSENGRALCVGGDHFVSYPILRAYAKAFANLTVVQFDAHPDLYDSFEGNRYSHACPFARVMEEGLATRLVQIGIRTMTPHQREQADRFGVEVIEMRNFSQTLELSFDGPVYITFDLDGLDPAFAPGVSHQEPGGFSTREALSIIHAIDAPIVGADVVELNPTTDIGGMTAKVAARLVKEIASQMMIER